MDYMYAERHVPYPLTFEVHTLLYQQIMQGTRLLSLSNLLQHLKSKSILASLVVTRSDGTQR